ncbi:MAG: ATP-dependent Clp protease proteolytic subunit [Patescibacteria group bacterium]|nr:ATP-dependent Clp protease proteolytic subunit [Patescibacteria group bacterium]MDE2438222.1 ATP-dependent Clp protease proteolytic subunit [Patescibacteria group bacterium]
MNDELKIQHIWCSALITKKMEDVLIGFICNQAQDPKQKISEYIIYLSTLGGNPFYAVNLYNFIKSIPQKTTVYNMGNVSSAGVPFFLGFQNRIGVPNCDFMIHQTTLSRDVLPEQFNVFDIDTQRASLSAIDEKTQNIIHKETSSRSKKPLSLATIKQAFLKTTTYTATEAQKYGFIDKIELPKLPDTGVLYLTDQYLATLPNS